jgi:Protein of unknown function (DUF2867)
MKNQAKECIIPNHNIDFPKFSYADSYIINVSKPINAPTAAHLALVDSPKWVDFLMQIRNLIVKPFGIAIDAGILPNGTKTIGMFPIINSNNDQIILGFDDIHLDFRIVIDAIKSGQTTKIVATTYVKTHNLLGKSYLFIIKPFHKLIVKQALENID